MPDIDKFPTVHKHIVSHVESMSYDTNSAIHKAAVRPATVQNTSGGRSCWLLPLIANGHFSVRQEFYTRQTSGMAVNCEAASFVNSAVRYHQLLWLQASLYKTIPACFKKLDQSLQIICAWTQSMPFMLNHVPWHLDSTVNSLFSFNQSI